MKTSDIRSGGPAAQFINQYPTKSLGFYRVLIVFGCKPACARSTINQ